MSPTDPGPAVAPECEPDYRFTLANERTFLAYLRTALALDAGGLAAVQFLTALEVEILRQVVGLVLVVAGALLSGGAYLRWRANLRAMRRSAPLPTSRIPLFLALVVVAVSVAAVFLVVWG